jgi:hypothetical protein
MGSAGIGLDALRVTIGGRENEGWKEVLLFDRNLAGDFPPGTMGAIDQAQEKN